MDISWMMTCRSSRNMLEMLMTVLQVAPGIAPQVDDQGLDTGIEQCLEFSAQSTIGARAEGVETQVADPAGHGPAGHRRVEYTRSAVISKDIARPSRSTSTVTRLPGSKRVQAAQAAARARRNKTVQAQKNVVGHQAGLFGRAAREHFGHNQPACL